MPENSSGILLRAQTIYLYLGKYGRVSRSSRMQWLLDHLDSVISLPVVENVDNIRKSIEVISIVPEPQPGVTWSVEVAHTFQYYVHPRTQLYFLSRQYCLTYCLDLSPSLSAVDIQGGEVLLDKVFTSLKTSLEGASQSFIVPGSQVVFYPDICVSIIVYTPFFTTPAQQVLVQSWRVTGQNLPELLKAVNAGLLRIESAVAHVAQLEQPAMVQPDRGFINMLRFGMLALRLLPTASVSGIVVVTDGVITLPDAWLLEATISRLRSTGIACHFIHVGTPYHPQVAYGRSPYKDLMEFLSNASMGILFTALRETSILDFRDLQINQFHRGFLAWSFQDLQPKEVNTEPLPSTFRFELTRKKQIEESLSVSLIKILCCRIREGYLISSMNLSESQVEITLHLLWKHNAYIEYTVVSKWPPTSHKVHYTLHVRATYEFLHDITCPKMRFQSPFRQAVVTRFWTTMKSIGQSDYLLVHLHSKESNSSWNVLPESIKSGMPLFYLSSGGNLTTNDVSNPQFAMYWKPISLLNPALWHKWLHVSRIGVLLRHDCPLPKHLHLRNASGRFQSVQCRQAETALFSLLRDMATFVLVENQTFVKLDENSFYVIRITEKAPCMVLHIAFPCGVPEGKRADVVMGVRGLLQEISCQWRASPSARRRQQVTRTFSRISCCLVLQKPVEKILVRYERAPTKFETVVFDDGTQPSLAAKAPERPGYLVTTLSRYLHHKRYIWEASVGATALARVLSTLTRLRLQEGFSFAHSQTGVVTLLLEAEAGEGDEADTARCVIQYVLFPPYCDTEDEDTAGCVVTESWVEPNSGLLRGLPYHKLGSAIASTDAICISTMLTFEHLNLMARDRSVNPPVNPRPLPKDTSTPCMSHETTPRTPLTNTSDSSKTLSANGESPFQTPNDRHQEFFKTPTKSTGLNGANENVSEGHSIGLLSTPVHSARPVTPPTKPLKTPLLHMDITEPDPRINRVPLLFDVIQLLPRSRQAELLFLMPVQDWQVPTKAADSNFSLMELIMEVLGTLNDRDLHFSEEDSFRFMEHLHLREKGSEGPLTVPKPDPTRIPRWRLFIKSFSATHIYLTVLPSTYADLKLLTEKEELIKEEGVESESWSRERQPSRSVSIEPEPSLDSLSDMGSRTQSLRKSDIADTSYVAALQTSLDSLIMPADNTLRVFTNIPKPFRLRASSLDTNLEKSRQAAARMSLEARHNLRTTSLEARQTAALDVSSIGSQISETDPPDSKTFSTIPLPIFIYDCPLYNLVDSLLYKDFKCSNDDSKS